jgi:hypothetical protein
MTQFWEKLKRQMSSPNVDLHTVLSFGDEWSRFDQPGMGAAEALKAFEDYFCVFPLAESTSKDGRFRYGLR